MPILVEPTDAEMWLLERDEMVARIAELERERDGLKKFIAKQAASVRVLQRRLAAAGLNANMPGDAERQSITND